MGKTTSKRRPILFQTDMVRSLLQGNKTKTRRIFKPQPTSHSDLERDMLKLMDHNMDYILSQCPYGIGGDQLWVRETFATVGDPPLKDLESFLEFGTLPIIEYRAGGTNNPNDRNEEHIEGRGKWRPSIFMPKWAARLTLNVLETKLVRVQNMTLQDAKDEGIQYGTIQTETGTFTECPRTVVGRSVRWRNYTDPQNPSQCGDPRGSYRTLWNSINGYWKPVKEKGKILRFECYPWSAVDIPDIPNKWITHHESARTKVPFLAYPNPWVWAVTFNVD